MQKIFDVVRYAVEQKLFPVGMMIFFFIVFDGTLMYLAPIVITDAGISESTMGIILGSSSIVGMAFDYFLYRMISHIHYRRIFLLMFAMALSFPMFLMGGNTVIIFLFAMAVWGIYYDLYNIGMMDMVERTSPPKEHAANFGIIKSFDALGYFVTPFFASTLLVFLDPGIEMFFAIMIPFLISFALYMNMVFNPIPERSKFDRIKEGVSVFFQKIFLGKKISLPMFPLFITLFIYLVDTAVWTFGPIFSEQMGEDNGMLGGIFMIAFALPPVLIGYFVGDVVKRFGSGHTAKAAIGISSLIFFFIGLVSSPLLLIVMIFFASFFLALGIPSVNSIYTGYINKAGHHRKETETIQDFFTNVGCTTGPIIGGYAAECFGLSHAFSALGVLGICVFIFLLVFNSKPRHD